MTVRSRLRISLLVEWSKESVSLLIESEQLLWKHRHWLTVDRMTSFSNEIWATRITWNIKCRQNPSKHHLGEGVLKTSWRRLQCNIFLSSKTSSRNNCKTCSWRRLEDVLGDKKMLRWRRFQEILKTSWKTRNVCWDIWHVKCAISRYIDKWLWNLKVNESQYKQCRVTLHFTIGQNLLKKNIEKR